MAIVPPFAETDLPDLSPEAVRRSHNEQMKPVTTTAARNGDQDRLAHTKPSVSDPGIMRKGAAFFHGGDTSSNLAGEVLLHQGLTVNPGIKEIRTAPRLCPRTPAPCSESR